MNARSLWDHLAEQGVPREHRSAACAAFIRFLNEHTTELQERVRSLQHYADTIAAQQRKPEFTPDPEAA